MKRSNLGKEKVILVNFFELHIKWENLFSLSYTKTALNMNDFAQKITLLMRKSF